MNGDDVIDAISEKATLPTAEHVVGVLKKHFLLHGDQVLKRTQPGVSVSHCDRSVAISHQYQRVRQRMVSHALLELRRDVTTRRHQFEVFVKSLQRMVNEECAALRAINSSTAAAADCAENWEEHKTNLIAVSSVCDEFRMHLNHWTCVKQRVYNRRWLRALVPELSEQLRVICCQFVRLQETALWWTEKLLVVGMQVFAYVDRKSLTYNDVFCIVRGIEEFNNLLPLVRVISHEMTSSASHGSVNNRRPSKGEIHDDAAGSVDSRHIKSVSFSKLLNSLAGEWSKSAVLITRNFLDNSTHLIGEMSRQQFSPPDAVIVAVTGELSDLTDMSDKRTSAAGRKSPMAAQSSTCSDYYSDSGSRFAHPNAASPSLAVDFTQDSPVSPLLDFGRKERDYISKVIQIACQRTSLLRKNKFSQGHSSSNSAATNSAQHLGASGDASPGNQSPHSLTSETKRKSVSWGDSQDMSVCRQLVIRYDDALWKAYGAGVEDYLLYNMSWGKPGGWRHGLGPLDTCSYTALDIFVSSMALAASKGYFTSVASRQVLAMCAALFSRLLFRFCDDKIAKCLASLSHDRAVAVPVKPGSSQTSATALLLRQAVRLLLDQVTWSPAVSASRLLPNPVVSSRVSYAELRHDWTTLHRLGTIADLCKRWCSDRAHQYLSSYKMSQFLLIVCSDLTVLHKDLTQSMEALATSVYMQEEVASVKADVNSLLSLHTQMMKALCAKVKSSCTQILASQMPPPKFWRKQNDTPQREMKAEPYMETIIDCVLVPVVEGIENLCEEHQATVLLTVLESVCDSWLRYYLTHKIKFSLSGAEQLSEDLSAISALVDAYVNNDTVKQRILQSEPIKRVQAAISLLSQQTPSDSSSLLSCTSIRARNVLGSNRVAPARPHPSYADSPLSSEERQRWLNLRQRVPGRSALFPCMSVTDQ